MTSPFVTSRLVLGCGPTWEGGESRKGRVENRGRGGWRIEEGEGGESRKGRVENQGREEWRIKEGEGGESRKGRVENQGRGGREGRGISDTC